MIRSLSVFLGFGLLLSDAMAETWSYSHPVTPRDSFASAEFILSLESAIEEPAALLVVAGPQDVDMREAYKASPWSRVAREQKCAVLGCKFTNKANADFSQVEQGSRAALLASLVEFSKMSERLRNLDRLKMIMAGRLAGAQFVYEFANRESDRVAGFICINPYYFATPPTGPLRKTPGFFLVAENEHPAAAAGVSKLFAEQRRYGALWAKVFWDESINGQLDLRLAGPFAHETLSRRIKYKNPLGVLVGANINDGWSLDLSQPGAPTITDSRNVPRGQEDRFAWFISENLAETVARLIAQPGATP